MKPNTKASMFYNSIYIKFKKKKKTKRLYGAGRHVASQNIGLLCTLKPNEKHGDRVGRK